MPYIVFDHASRDSDPPREGHRRAGQHRGAGDLEGAPTRQNVAGIRYRLAFVRRGEGVPVVLYDWHPPKGHHRHVEGIEEPYRFVDVDQLLRDFTIDVRRVMGDATWPRR